MRPWGCLCGPMTHPRPNQGGWRPAPFGGLSDTTMEPSWKQSDVFPIIAGIIEQAYREHQRFITAQEIASRLLQDTEGRNLVEPAREQQQEKQSLEWLASNVVSWFSQRITVGVPTGRGRSSGPKSMASGRTSPLHWGMGSSCLL